MKRKQRQPKPVRRTEHHTIAIGIEDLVRSIDLLRSQSELAGFKQARDLLDHCELLLRAVRRDLLDSKSNEPMPLRLSYCGNYHPKWP